jgi:hypothetical protein
MGQQDRHSVIGGAVLILLTVAVVGLFMWPAPMADSTRSIRIIPYGYVVR